LVREKQLRRLWRLLGWFVVVDGLITMFGVTTGPLLLSLAADTAVALLIIRSCIELRAATARTDMPSSIAGRAAHLKAVVLIASFDRTSQPSDYKGG
jgi:hypothetical protein